MEDGAFFVLKLAIFHAGKDVGAQRDEAGGGGRADGGYLAGDVDHARLVRVVEVGEIGHGERWHFVVDGQVEMERVGRGNFDWSLFLIALCYSAAGLGYFFSKTPFFTGRMVLFSERTRKEASGKSLRSFLGSGWTQAAVAKGSVSDAEGAMTEAAFCSVRPRPVWGSMMWA